MKEGRLISFEGVDGAGKTTQIDLLERWLKSRYIPYLRTREPGGTPLGAEIKDILLLRPEFLPITPLAELFLFEADRAQHFDLVIKSALEEGKLVITDRFSDASIAYQGYALGLDVKLIEDLSLIATQGRVPDLTILLDLNPAQVHRRVGMVEQLALPIAVNTSNDEGHDHHLTENQNGVREERNRLDVETQSFHRRVRDGFRELARAHPERIKVVDASRPIQQIHQRIIALVEPLLRTN